jgi:glycosyltransferase involved in cell wall biosynthesis
MQLIEKVRFIASFAPLMGIIPKPEDRPKGVSALVRVRGEEEWIEPSLLSIQEFADEILVLDNGASPQTQEVLERLRGPLHDLLQFETCHNLNLYQLSNLGLEKARFRWVVRWDADFVAHTSGKGDIRNLRRYLFELDHRRYYLLYLTATELAGDLFHQFPDLRIRRDGQVHTASRWARYVPVHRNLKVSGAPSPDQLLREGSRLKMTKESLKVPKFYQIIRCSEVTYFHVNVKSAWHTLQRHFWLEWLGQGNFRTYPTLKSYTLAQIQNLWGFSSPEEAAQYFMTLYCQKLETYDSEPSGPYPELLQPFLTKPKYRMEYKDGKIIGRREDP